MLEEAPVLDRHEGLRQVGRQLLQGDRAPAGLAPVGEERAVARHDGDVRRPLRHCELVDRRQLRGVIGDDARDRDEAPQAEDEGRIDETAENRAAALARPARPAALRFSAALRAPRGSTPRHAASGPVLRREPEFQRSRIGARVEDRLPPATSVRHLVSLRPSRPFPAEPSSTVIMAV
jgi:hypothetical protein